MSVEGDDMFLFIVEGVVLTTVSVLGLVGTIMSIYVLLKPRIRDCFSTLLTGLAVCDSIFLLFAVLIFGLPSLWRWYGNNLVVHIIPFSHGAIHIARMGSVYITMSVTLERFLAVVYPLRRFTAKKFLLPGTAVFAILYNIPKFFEMETYAWPINNETAIRETALRKNPIYSSYYLFWSKIVFMEMIPYLTIIILNTFIVWKIVKSSKFRRNFQSNNPISSASSHRSHHGHHVVSTTLSGEPDSPAPHLISHHRSYYSTKNLRSTAGAHVGSTEEESLTRDPRTSVKEKKEPLSAEKKRKRFSENRYRGNGLTSVSGSVSSFTIRGRETNGRGGCHSGPTSSDLYTATESTSSPVTAGAVHALGAEAAATAHNMPKQHEVSLAITLVAISLLFIVCQSVKIITDVYELFCDKFKAGEQKVCNSNSYIEIAVSFANLSTCVNSAANFLVYMLRGKKFRDLFLETYCCCLRRSPQGCCPRRRSLGRMTRMSRAHPPLTVYSLRRSGTNDSHFQGPKKMADATAPHFATISSVHDGMTEIVPLDELKDRSGRSDGKLRGSSAIVRL